MGSMDFPVGGTLTAIGTSIGVGLGTTEINGTYPNAYPAQLAAAAAMLLNNQSVSGSQMADASVLLGCALNGQTTTTSPQVTSTTSTCAVWEQTINDIRVNGVNGVALDNALALTTFGATRLLVPTASWTTWTTESTVLTFDANWTNPGFFQRTYVNGAKATMVMQAGNTCLYLGSVMSVASSGSAALDVSVNGTPYPPINQVMQSQTQMGSTYGYTAVRYTNLPAGATIVFTAATSSVANGCFLGPWYQFAEPADLGPKLLIYSAWGLPVSQYESGSDDAVRQLNRVLQRIVNGLQSDGRNVQLVPVRIGRTTDINTTLPGNPPIHPNDNGASQLANEGFAIANGLTLSTLDLYGSVQGWEQGLSTYTPGSSPQTGDGFSRLGAPVGASTSADIAAIKALTPANQPSVNGSGQITIQPADTPAAAAAQTRINLALPNAAPATPGGIITVGTGPGEIDPDGSGNVSISQAAIAAVASAQLGSGNTAVNHNTGGTDNLRLEVEGTGIDGANVRAYLATDYNAGNCGSAHVKGQTMTGPVGGGSGRIPNPMYLQAGNTYTIEFDKPGIVETVTMEITI